MNDTIKSTVDEWLGEIENFSLRAERLPEGNVSEWMPWLYAAAEVGAETILENKKYLSDQKAKSPLDELMEARIIFEKASADFHEKWKAYYADTFSEDFTDIAAVLFMTKIEWLEDELDIAIEAVWRSGGHDWVKEKYPKHYECLARYGVGIGDDK